MLKVESWMRQDRHFLHFFAGLFLTRRTLETRPSPRSRNPPHSTQRRPPIMICNSCRRAIISTVRVSRNTRSVATAPATSNAAPVHPPSIALPGSPARLSSSRPGISQPLSTPDANAEGRLKTQSPRSVKLPKSSVPGGTELRGIAYLKGKPTVLAKEDDEYPSWLWGLLEEGKMGETKVDLSGMILPYSCLQLLPALY